MTQENDWLLPAPLWSTNGYRQVEFYRPALFEFNSDAFMEEFLAALTASTPKALKEARLQPQADGSPNKLFLPVHGSFYLAAASLCCREPGFPSREVRQADGELAAFVLRKLVNGKEYGWVVTEEDKGWKPLDGTARALLRDEDRLPVFRALLNDGRPVYCAYIPASSSETYNVPPAQLVLNDGTQPDPPKEELASRFITPLAKGADGKSLIDKITDDNAAWTTSVYLLVELWEFLVKYFPDLSTALQAGTVFPTFSGDKATALSDLYNFLRTQIYKGTLTLAQALKKVADNYPALNAVGGGDLATLGFANLVYNLKNSSVLSAGLPDLEKKVVAALPDEREPIELPKLEVNSSTRYVLRFVYLRPQCDPPVVEVSLPSQPFTFAPFFDPDSPARPIKIPLPTDVSIAGMRKFKKNVTFLMSDAMRKKMDSIAGQEAGLLDGSANPVDQGGAFAFVCSFSIQIIFMIAFMLLLIFVVVFNIIFWWLAFFRICLPVPKALIPE